MDTLGGCLEVGARRLGVCHSQSLNFCYVLGRIIYHGASTPESEMEKIRYYVELPGDLYEDGYFMDLVKIAMGPLRTEEGRVPHELLLRQNQTYLELQVVDPSEA